ncbi:hypothetical protein COT47_00770 [Candidatus Woesearchaeota archaeon CG08_land_8_20_14_0_20_43_7]|nr:MAG: hypothetical protein COT47_00770 [Candidatus Woesearchaeota archaeon CG08_land_8_20_14_0_20_43_7]
MGIRKKILSIAGALTLGACATAPATPVETPSIRPVIVSFENKTRTPEDICENIRYHLVNGNQKTLGPFHSGRYSVTVLRGESDNPNYPTLEFHLRRKGSNSFLQFIDNHPYGSLECQMLCKKDDIGTTCLSEPAKGTAHLYKTALDIVGENVKY